MDWKVLLKTLNDVGLVYSMFVVKLISNSSKYVGMRAPVFNIKRIVIDYRITEKETYDIH